MIVIEGIGGTRYHVLLGAMGNQEARHLVMTATSTRFYEPSLHKRKNCLLSRLAFQKLYVKNADWRCTKCNDISIFSAFCSIILVQWYIVLVNIKFGIQCFELVLHAPLLYYHQF